VLSNPPPWPHGARCAAAVTFDVDSDSILRLEHPADAHRRVGAQSWLRYDQVAVPRIVELFARLGLRQTFFVPSWCAERYPEVVETIAAGGHEVAAHGYLHELAHTLEPEREHELIRRSADILERVAGRRPRGWRGPLYTFSDRTAEFLAQEGYAYHSGLMGDDVPYVLSTAAGEIVELPVDWANDDWPQFANTMDLDWRTPTRSPERGYEVFEAELDAALDFGGLWIAVWHPFVSGRPARLRRLEGLIERAGERGAWFAPLEEIAAHVDELRRTGRWRPRVERLPYDDAPAGDPRG
jgi:peptidoglycan/xylan/chitin deacetylase (PgdA/CDA1 family)